MTDIQAAIDVFEDPRVQESIARFVTTKGPRVEMSIPSGLEVAIEIGVFRIVYVSGVIAVCRIVSGQPQDKVIADLCRRIDELALLQMPAHEA